VHLAALDLSGATPTVLPWNPGLTDPRPKALAVAGGDVAVYGLDMAFGAQPRTGLAALDLVTGDVLPFAPRLDSGVVAVAATSSSVYVSGSFTAVNGVPRNRVAAVDPHGALLPWTTGVIADVRLMRPVGTDVFLGLTSDVVLVDGVTGAARPWRLRTNGVPRALREVGGTVYLGGDFSVVVDASGTTRSRTGLAAFDLATAALLPFAPAVTGGSVQGLDVSGPLLYLAGDFTGVAAQVRAYVAAVDRTSGVVAPFAPVANAAVERVSVRGGAVYLAGAFSPPWRRARARRRWDSPRPPGRPRPGRRSTRFRMPWSRWHRTTPACSCGRMTQPAGRPRPRARHGPWPRARRSRWTGRRRSPARAPPPTSSMRPWRRAHRPSPRFP
jgi:hypothetical protein